MDSQPQDPVNKEQLNKLRKALIDANIEYMLTKVEGDLAHVTVWIGDPTV
tara:strand:- start:95 stop:244 length:150 start_codon:yes stop_codon:yes gene_type:complete